MRIAPRAAISAAALGVVAGCYTLVPATTGVVPSIGTDVAFDINDAGRLALGGSMGPEIAQVEGRLLDSDSSEYVVAVSDIKLLRGGEQSWSGERVHLKSEYVAAVYERRFSRSRSIAMGAAGIGLIAAIAGRSIIGAGGPDEGRVPPDTAQTHRVPHP